MSIRESFKKAFAISEEDKKLTAGEAELLEKIAQGVVDRRLTTIALTFLESVKYLSFVSSQALLFFQPIVQSIFPNKTYDQIQRLLEKRCSIEYLLTSIEKLAGGV